MVRINKKTEKTRLAWHGIMRLGEAAGELLAGFELFLVRSVK